MTDNRPTRRRFIRDSGLAVLGSGLAAHVSCSDAPVAGDESPELIDIHQHLNYSGRLNKGFLAHQKIMGANKTVLLPAGSVVRTGSTHEGKSNGLAARIHGNIAALRLVTEHPDAFAFFANEVPDLPIARQEIEKYLEKGAIGIGEQKFNIPCDSAPMERVAEIARAYDVPVLIHFQHETYNTGFEKFHRILEKFPQVNFIGHAQTWWGNIDENHDQSVMYPKTKVTPGGITDRYLSDYANMFGDLSAGSGQNSLTRDEDHAADFLARHQDKLLFGSDWSDSIGKGEACIGAKTLSVLRRLVPDDSALRKILSANARRIMRI